MTTIEDLTARCSRLEKNCEVKNSKLKPKAEIKDMKVNHLIFKLKSKDSSIDLVRRFIRNNLISFFILPKDGKHS